MSSATATSGGLFSRNSGQTPMRGLVSFIADLRNARARELEEKRINKELANIRQRFKEPGLNGYQRKKYVCKLLYIYILGWDVAFGHVEAVRLASATAYSEKQIGYLAVTLFLHEEHELLPLVVNTFRKDLADQNELNNCLALHAVANVGSREMADALSVDVYRLLVSPVSRSFVKKKAALTLLRLYRKHPVILDLDWAPKLIALMDDSDVGVALSVLSLVATLVQAQPDGFKDSYVKAVRRLKGIVIDRECAADYYYYKVPCPWLQVKLMRLLQYYPPSPDSLVRDLLRTTLLSLLETKPSKNVQQNNAQNAVLFEAISLAIHLGDDTAITGLISVRLGEFIQSRETNVRYLGMAAMTHLAARSHDVSAIRQHQPVIMGALRDRDVTVRRQGLDLLYSISDTATAPGIVAELLVHLAAPEASLRDEIVLKIAILAEKYATEARWYVDTALRLLATAGDSVRGDVWQRVVQVVTNNDALHEYAARTVLDYIRQAKCPDAVVKIGAYLLGEFGHLISDQAGASPTDQFEALQRKINPATASTRAMITSCMVKFVNVFPEIKPSVVALLHIFARNFDPELQQRACEYLALATMPSDDLLRTVCDEMPPFPARTSALLARLHHRHAAAEDRHIWLVGGRAANEDPAEHQLAQKPTADSTEHGDLAGIDFTSPTGPGPETMPSSGWESGYQQLMYNSDAVLFENSLVRLSAQRTSTGSESAIMFTFLNRQPDFPLRSLTATVEKRGMADGGELASFPLLHNLRSLPDPTVPARGRATQEVVFQTSSVFRHEGAAGSAPVLRLSFLAGTVHSVVVRIPFGIHHFASPVSLSADDFFRRWKQIGGGPREAQRIFGLASGATAISADMTAQTVRQFGWGILDRVDPNKNNVVGASIVHTTENGKFGCLMRLEPNYETMMYRLTIRATGDAVPGILLDSMVSQLELGAE